MLTRDDQQRIDHARDTLREFGFYANNLWHVDDVKTFLKCDDDTAQEILENAFQNEATYQQIWASIESAIFELKQTT